MAKFKIIRENPSVFKAEILHFWTEYLPGTPPERLGWMENNPAGPVIWFFAIEEKTGILAGTISLFPKDLFLHGKKIRAAILGDFMLHKKFRVFGPALDLLKAAINCREQGEFAFLYTVPNLKSRKVAERVGFRSAGQLYSMMCPQQCDFLIEKYVGPLAARVIQKPLLLLLRLFSQVTYRGNAGVFEEIDWDADEISAFCLQVRGKRTHVLTSDCSLSYLEWRYVQNPEFNFKIVTLREREGTDMLGFFVFSLDRHRLEVYDIVSRTDRAFLMMLKQIYTIGKEARSRGVYISVYENNPLLSMLKRCCFFDTKDQVEIYTYPGDVKEIGNWAFTSADRNI